MTPTHREREIEQASRRAQELTSKVLRELEQTLLDVEAGVLEILRRHGVLPTVTMGDYLKSEFMQRRQQQRVEEQARELATLTNKIDALQARDGR